MDRSWIGLDDRWCSEYVNGVNDFINFASRHSVDKDSIRCPCSKCVNVYYMPINMVRGHLHQHGMAKEYKKWVFHGHNNGLPEEYFWVGDGEFPVSGVDVEGMITDLQEGMLRNSGADCDAEPIISDKPPKAEFDKLLSEAKIAAYPGCDTFSKLSFVIRLLYIKTTCKMSHEAVNQMLDLIRKLVPGGGEYLPKSCYEAKKLLRDLGFGYINIDACPKNCVLYWKENEKLEQCPNCNEPRWKECSKSSEKRIPRKVLRYFPLKPRLQKLFMSEKTAKDMRWHKETRAPDSNVIGHLADAKQWKDFDKEHDWFAKDPRNIRLGLASDGFNPFNNIGSTYSMWPVMLVIYNVRPTQVIKEPFIIMTLLIPGPDSPGNDIDVYLRPLIDELKEFWEVGVETFDAYSGETFRLHAALMWTINNFPAYAMLSGWSTKGKLACPPCNKETHSIYLKHCRKPVYMGHRRFLPQNHVWRRRKKFNGKSENAPKPKELTGDDVLVQLESLPSNLKFGKTEANKKRKRNKDTELNWRKKSIFFELSYWHKLPLRHNIDVMHTEKNITESMVGTLMNTEGKTKDHKNARLDLKELGMRKDLHPQSDDKLPPAPYCLDVGGKKRLCAWLKTIRFPDGYASNISRCVSSHDNKIIDMKSHDYHVLLQRLLPLAVRGNLSKKICDAITELSMFFKELSSRNLTMDSLERLEEDIALILCKFELIFPPSFWDVMMHLPVHLPREAMYGGPVQYSWMYPIERYLYELKQYVRNRARPEGSIAEAYIDNECLNFCSMYMHGLETIYNRKDRNDEGDNSTQGNTLSIFSRRIRPLNAGKIEELSHDEHASILWFVLNNCEELEPYMNMHRAEIAARGSTDVERTHLREFPKWFKNLMVLRHRDDPTHANDDLYSLSLGPQRHVRLYKGCIINGMRFHTTARDEHRVTQNSGVLVRADHDDKEIDFYGVLNKIVELTYVGSKRVFLFHCTWFNTGDPKTGVKRDKYFTSVNINRTCYSADPYILASQADQVFYVPDHILGKNYKIVQRIQPRGWYTNPEIDEDTNSVVGIEDDVFQQIVTSGIDGMINVDVEEDDFQEEAPHAANIDDDEMFEIGKDGGDGIGIGDDDGEDDYDTNLGD